MMNLIDVPLAKLEYDFIHKPLVIGGVAKEFHGVRKAGADIDLVASKRDHLALSRKFPDEIKDNFGDHGIIIYEFEIWDSILLFDYEFYSEKAIELDNYLIASLEKLVFMSAIAMERQKYKDDLKLLIRRVKEMQYASS